MQTFRAFLTTVIGLTITGFAFVVAAAFSFAVIVLVASAALVGIAIVKLAPHVRAAANRLQTARRPARVWNDGNGLIVDA